MIYSFFIVLGIVVGYNFWFYPLLAHSIGLHPRWMTCLRIDEECFTNGDLRRVSISCPFPCSIFKGVDSCVLAGSGIVLVNLVIILSGKRHARGGGIQGTGKRQ